MLPCEDRGAERRSWFVFVVQLPRGRGPRRRDRARWRERGHRVQGLPARASTSSRSTASGSASAAASSRSPRRWRRARSRCPSSPRWGSPRSSGWRGAGDALGGADAAACTLHNVSTLAEGAALLPSRRGERVLGCRPGRRRRDPGDPVPRPAGQVASTFEPNLNWLPHGSERVRADGAGAARRASRSCCRSAARPTAACTRAAAARWPGGA